MRRFGQHLLRFFLPWACAGCRTPLASLEDEGFCGSCWLAVPRIQPPVCQICGIPLKEGGNSCYDCREAPRRLRVRAATEYRGVLAPAVYRFKYLGRKSLARPFGTLLRYAWEQSPELHQARILVPVPLHPRNERRRGYNQAALLAEELARHTARPVLPILVRTRQTTSQTTLDRTARQANMQGAFALDPALSGSHELLKKHSYLLIDDVCTTTSTLAQCAKTLFGIGIRTVYALVLARDL